jgi:hypothetical protein
MTLKEQLQRLLGEHDQDAIDFAQLKAELLCDLEPIVRRMRASLSLDPPPWVREEYRTLKGMQRRLEETK